MPTLAQRTSRRALVVILLVLAGLTAIAVADRSGDGGRSDAGAAVPSTTQSAAGLQQQFEEVVCTVSPQVVQIQGERGLGSGVVFDDRADVVTNAHVVDGERQFVVTLSGGDQHPATLVGSDPAHDLAVVHLTGATPAAATFADSPSPQVGDLVLAIGNPLGLRSSVTQGIVSSLNRSVPEGDGITLSSVIQTSAPINPGNSGGALVDLRGRVIGIPSGVNVLILSASEQDEEVLASVRAGACGFLPRETGPAELIDGVRAVAAGEAAVSPGVVRGLIAELASQPDPRLPSPDQLDELTPREREVMGLVAAGLSNDQIAEHLVISRATAKTHVSRALVKLHARDRAQLVTLAYEAGLVLPRQPAAARAAAPAATLAAA